MQRASPGLLAHLESLVREADADLALIARLHDERLKVVRLPPPGHRPVALRAPRQVVLSQPPSTPEPAPL